MIWLLPAIAVVGKESTNMTTVSGELGQVPNDVVHTNVLIPFVNPETGELLIVLVRTEPPPFTTDHEPKPMVGVLPLNTVVDEQIV